MRQVTEDLGDRAPEVHWKPFSLRQVNFPDQSKRVWERDADDKPGKGHRGFRLCLRARERWGEEGIDRMYAALGRARFERKADLEDEEVLLEAAREAGFTEEEARAAMYDRFLDERLGASHDEGVALGVFGVPTLTFDGAHPLFAAVLPAPPREETLAVYEQVVRFARMQPYLRELKRAKPPQRPAEKKD